MAILKTGSERFEGAAGAADGRAPGAGISPELQRLIAEEAYRLSEQRGFESGFEDQDWIAAKRLVMESFLSGQGH